MCGFAGVIAWDEKYRITQAALAKMSAAIAHRGPDGEGFHLTKENEPITPDSPQVGLAFRRLAILDPDPRSDQPFHIGPLTLVFNGEIYNFRELRNEISKLRPDYQWRTTGDTEVLLMAYEMWQEKCVEKLNGMFAFAVWDQINEKLFLARDRMGQKPLFWAKPAGGGALAFASELGALRRLSWFDAKVNQDALIEFLRYGCFHAEQTVYCSVSQIQPAQARIEGSSSLWSEEYFNANRAMAALDDSTAARSCAQLLRKAVQRQLVSDVPLGVFLSGGIDSSVIALCAADVKTFSITFDDPRYDESRYARAVAEHLGTEHHEFRVTVDAAADLPKLAAAFGEPFGDSSALPVHYLARETRKHVKVALSGDGGDELFGGYDRYRAIALSQRLENLVPTFVTARLGRLGGHPKSTANRAGRFFRSLRMPMSQRYASYRRIFDDEQITQLLGAAESNEPDVVARLFETSLIAGARPAEGGLAVDRVTYLPDDLLTKLDRASMLHNLEVRSPFMDHELVQFAAGLTSDQLLKGGPKRMLRDAFAADLPDFVFKRRKMGFAVPIGQWFRGQLREMLRDNLFAADSFARSHFNVNVVQRLIDEHEQQRVDHSQRLYALLMLELWWNWHRSLG